MAEYLESDPDWYRSRFCAGCRKRNEQCVCDLTFAERAASVSVHYLNLKRKREGVGPPGHRRYG